MAISGALKGSLSYSIRAFLALTILTLFSIPCLAQYNFEIQPFSGYKYGGGVNVGANILGVSRINVDSSISYGATATYNFAEHLGVEFLWDRQPTNASANYAGGGSLPTKVGLKMDQYQGNFLMSLTGHGSKLEPFVLLGAGASNMRGAGSSTTKFSSGLGGGVKYFMTPHVGLRLQARYTPTYAYTSRGGIWCNWWGVCWSVPNNHFINQGEVTGGVIFRF